MSLSSCDDAMTFNHFAGLCANLYHMDELDNMDQIINTQKVVNHMEKKNHVHDRAWMKL
jgi:hypothetical protein